MIPQLIALRKMDIFTWADDSFTDNSDNYHQRVVGIIEDKDGKIYKVPPDSIILFPKKTLHERLQEA